MPGQQRERLEHLLRAALPRRAAARSSAGANRSAPLEPAHAHGARGGGLRGEPDARQPGRCARGPERRRVRDRDPAAQEAEPRHPQQRGLDRRRAGPRLGGGEGGVPARQPDPRAQRGEPAPRRRLQQGWLPRLARPDGRARQGAPVGGRRWRRRRGRGDGLRGRPRRGGQRRRRRRVRAPRRGVRDPVPGRVPLPRHGRRWARGRARRDREWVRGAHRLWRSQHARADRRAGWTPVLVDRRHRLRSPSLGGRGLPLLARRQRVRGVCAGAAQSPGAGLRRVRRPLHRRQRRGLRRPRALGARPRRRRLRLAHELPAADPELGRADRQLLGVDRGRPLEAALRGPRGLRAAAGREHPGRAVRPDLLPGHRARRELRRDLLPGALSWRHELQRAASAQRRVRPTGSSRTRRSSAASR